MNEILHANIFFFIASIATVIFIIFISIILYQVAKIAKSLRSIVEKIEAGSEVLAGDIADLRRQVMSGGFISRLLGLFLNFGNFGGGEMRHKRSTRRSRKTKVNNDEDEE